MHALNSDNPILMGCGRCTGCRIDKAQDWAIRCKHEASLYEQNSFITLTYSDEHLPEDYSVSKRVWQLFMKRLRNYYGESKIRFYACGEYGDQKYRPHYHALLFNLDFSDKKFFKLVNGERLYTSEILSTLWPYGQATTGDVTYQSAGYCTRYVMKKMVGDKADEHYWRINPLTQQFVRQTTEFQLCSRRPGIASGWFEKFKSDVFPSDFVVVDGMKKPVPQYYIRKLQEEELKQHKQRRRKRPREHIDEAKRRRSAHQVIRDQKLNQLKRTLED